MKMSFQPPSIVRSPLQIIFALLVTLNVRAAIFTDNNWISMGGIPGADDAVFATVVDGTGNLYIGGAFTVVGDVLANGVAKWNGTNWSALGEGVGNDTGDFSVAALALSGTNLYAAGYFTRAGGVPANHIAKWDGNSWSALGSGMNAGVGALVLSGTNLYAGGDFTTAGGVSANRIARWDGSGWSALGSGMNGSVNSLALSGTNLYAGGTFTTAGQRIARWNGNSWSALGSGMNDTVWDLAVLGNDLYAGGDFTTAGGVPAHLIAKWNGSSWSALGSGFHEWSVQVLALAVAGTNLYVGGNEISLDNTLTGIFKWDGSSWSILAPGVSMIFGMVVSGNEVYAGGDFTTGIAKWNGSSWSALSSGMDSTVLALAVSGSDLLIGGNFLNAGDIAANHIVKWNGSSWSALGSGVDNFVRALAVSGSNLYAGGPFTAAGGVAANRIAKWNGSNWSALGSGMGGGSPPYVYSLAASGSNVYAGGGFTTAGGGPAMRIAKWNGSQWSGLGLGLNSSLVYALAVKGDDLYAGGGFTRATNSDGAAVLVNRIAKWDGSNWSALGSGMDLNVFAFAVMGNDLYAGGAFTTVTNSGGVPVTVNRIAKWNGDSWSALGAGMDNRVMALAVSGNDLYAMGDFTTAGGIPANGIAKWNGTNWSALGSGLVGSNPSSFRSLAILGNDLFAGGDFLTAGGKVSPYIARARISFTPDNLALKANAPGALTNTLTFAGVPNYPYVVQYATNLTGSPWLTLSTNAPVANGVGTALDPAATGPQRFYRVRYLE